MSAHRLGPPGGGVAVIGVDGVDRRQASSLRRVRGGMFVQEQCQGLRCGGNRSMVGGDAPVGEQRPVVPVAGRDA